MLHGKTIGVIGTGSIGTYFCQLLQTFGYQVVAYDLHMNAMGPAKCHNHWPYGVFD
jgi:phosphoglycerate dehydrogenase-like enzyme